MSQQLRSIAEVAAALSVSPHTLRTWIKQRHISSYKLGKRVLLSQEDVQRFLDRHHRVETVSVGDDAAT